MDEKLKEYIYKVCSGFTTQDVRVSHIFDQRRFAKMAHYAWKHEIGFHPDMFKEALLSVELFKHLSDAELDTKSSELCHQADFAKAMFHAAFDFGNL